MVKADFITPLALALEARDKYTSGHSQRVSNIALMISRKLEINQGSIRKIELAGLVHDIGKVGIKESVLTKRDKLTDEEYAHISAHSLIGENILRAVIDDEEILKIVRNHHERYDGSGYPDGLSGEDIPLGARILAVADTYDAMTTDRPYRKALSHETAIAELKEQSGIQLDPAVVDVFCEMADGAAVTYLKARAVAV